MADERKRSGWGWVVATLLVLLAEYTAGYIFAGHAVNTSSVRGRHYATRRIARLFIPAAWVEAQIAGKDTVLCYVGADSPWDEIEYEASPCFARP